MNVTHSHSFALLTVLLIRFFNFVHEITFYRGFQSTIKSLSKWQLSYSFFSMHLSVFDRKFSFKRSNRQYFVFSSVPCRLFISDFLFFSKDLNKISIYDVQSLLASVVIWMDHCIANIFSGRNCLLRRPFSFGCKDRNLSSQCIRQ